MHSAGFLPGCENLFVLQLLHPGGGSHRHGDYDVVDVEGAFTSPPLDGLLLGDKGTCQGFSLDVFSLQSMYAITHLTHSPIQHKQMYEIIYDLRV